MRMAVGIPFESQSLNGDLDGGQTRKFLLHNSCCMTPFTSIPAMTTQLLLISSPTPQPRQGWVSEPLRSLARWILQKLVRQLLPQSSAEPKVSHLQALCHLGMLILWYTNKSPTSAIDKSLYPGPWVRSPPPPPPACHPAGRNLG